MHLIQLFYSSSNRACMKTFEMLSDIVEREEDVILVSYDLDEEEGRDIADRNRIGTVPTTIVDGTRVIRGVPQNSEQVLGER